MIIEIRREPIIRAEKSFFFFHKPRPDHDIRVRTIHLMNHALKALRHVLAIGIKLHGSIVALSKGILHTSLLLNIALRAIFQHLTR